MTAEYRISELHCAVCDHHFTDHKNGGECTIRPGPLFCGCSSYRSPRPVEDA